MYSKSLIKGTLQPIVLQLLKNNTRMYGYEITQRVMELTDGKIEITEGALYPTLHKLEAEGTLSTEKEFIGKRVRKYYTLTNSGNAIATTKINEVIDFMSTVALVLKKSKSPAL